MRVLDASGVLADRTSHSFGGHDVWQETLRVKAGTRGKQISSSLSDTILSPPRRTGTMNGDSQSPGRGMSFGISNCWECSVRIPKTHASICRCCVADADPNSDSVGANTSQSHRLMPPAPTWAMSNTRRFPQLENVLLIAPDGSECDVALWWMPQRNKWIAQHPLEYPRNRLRSVTGWDIHPAA